MGGPPSRALLIAAGLLTQLLGAACLVLALASLPVVHDLHGGTRAAIASVVAALGAIVCGTLVWRGRLIPLALATGLDVGLGLVLPRGTSGIGALVRMLPAGDAATAEALVTAGAIALFAAALACLLAIPSAIKLRTWARAELARPGYLPEPRTPGTTLRGWGTMKLAPAQVLRADAGPRSRSIVILAVAIPLIAVGIAIISASTDTSGARDDLDLGSGSPIAAARPIADARPPVPPADAAEPSLDDFLARYHAALGGGDPAALAALLEPHAFGFGVDAHAIAEGAGPVATQALADLGAGEVTVRFHQVGRDGDVAWVAEELRVGGSSFVATAAVGLAPAGWTIHALHVARAMPNDEAYRLARDGELAVPDAIPDLHDASPLAAAMRAAFASRAAFVEARSARADAFNFGSAPGERLTGGDAIRAVFGRLRATVHLHDAVRVGAIGTHGGWGAANVDFTDADATQTFRVLAVWVSEPAGWRIVQTQWSNAR